MPAPEPSYVRKADFVRPIDGDSFIVRLDHGSYPVSRSETSVEVRVRGLFCAELDEPGGQEARAYTTGLLAAAKAITVQTFRTKGGGATGSFARTVADVWVDGELLADKVIAAGHGTTVDSKVKKLAQS